MDWIQADTSLIFEKKKRSSLRVTNFIPKTFIIIIPEINYFKLILKNASYWDSNLETSGL